MLFYFSNQLDNNKLKALNLIYLNDCIFLNFLTIAEDYKKLDLLTDGHETQSQVWSQVAWSRYCLLD